MRPITARRGAATTGAAIVLMLSISLVAFHTAVATANPGQGTTIDLYSRLTDLNGTAMPSQPGDQGLVGRDLYVLSGDASSPAPAGDPIGRLVGRCMLVTSSEVLCDGVFSFDGRGTLTAYLEFDAGAAGNVEAITGGTGEFTGAAGTIEETPVAGHPADHLYHIEITGRSQG
jgi:hypothetical protein